MENPPKPSPDTALVTGASGGLGEAFARLLAADGTDLVLVARSGDALARLGEELSGRHGIRVRILALDLATAAAPAQVLDFLREHSIEVGVLINNAGVGSFGRFAESDPAADLAQIQLNVGTLTQLTRLLLPGMIERRRGRILNVGSIAAFQPGPLMAIYYATKAYVLSFSEALAHELKGTGVTVTCLCPGATRTGFMKRANLGEPPSLRGTGILMEASTVARRGYRGLMKGKRVVIPGLLNRLLAFSVRFVSRGLSAGVVRHILEGIGPASGPQRG